MVGDILLVRVDQTVLRPLIVASVDRVPVFERQNPTVDNPTNAPMRMEWRVSGLIIAMPEDHQSPAFRGAIDKVGDPARITGRPDRSYPFGSAEYLAPGHEIGQWRRT